MPRSPKGHHSGVTLVLLFYLDSGEAQHVECQPGYEIPTLMAPHWGRTIRAPNQAIWLRLKRMMCN